MKVNTGPVTVWPGEPQCAVPARPAPSPPASRPCAPQSPACCARLLRLVSSSFIALAATKADGFALYFLGECNNVSI